MDESGAYKSVPLTVVVNLVRVEHPSALHGVPAPRGKADDCSKRDESKGYRSLEHGLTLAGD